MNVTNNKIVMAITNEARRIEEDSLYSARGHFEAAATWNKWHKCLGIPATVLAAAVGVFASSVSPLYLTPVALLAAILTAVMTWLEPSKSSAKHLSFGNLYNSLRNDARIFSNISCKTEEATSELEAQLKALARRRNSLNEESPLIPRHAYERAKKGIVDGEATHQIDNTGL